MHVCGVLVLSSILVQSGCDTHLEFWHPWVSVWGKGSPLVTGTACGVLECPS